MINTPVFSKLFGWLDSDLNSDVIEQNEPYNGEVINYGRLAPFLFLHVGVLAVFWVGVSHAAIFICVALYFIRMFAITGFYHRYFSHKSFETNRFFQFLFAIMGLTSVQRGPLWWASNHRHHHQYSDKNNDLHSPVTKGFLWSHIGWILCDKNMPTHYERVKELSAFPELVFVNRFDWLVPLLFSIALYWLGVLLNNLNPELGTTGWQIFTWGFFVSTVLLFHGTCTINSLSHVYGSKRFETGDESRNNALLALITLGEGWHNNHHRYPGSVRQGFYWWEIDITYYILRVMSWVGIVKNLRSIPQSVYDEAALLERAR